MAEVSMRYSEFVPRAYNLACSLGFEPGKIMPSRAFCSDESQGYPIILIAKHFGTFPFNHGLVGGIVDSNRHGPYAQHGKDLFIIQASHVGYDPDTERYGIYRRLQTSNKVESTNCGKICGALGWYSKEYTFARNNIYLTRENKKSYVIIDNELLKTNRDQGLILRLERFVQVDEKGVSSPERSLSTSKVFAASSDLLRYLEDYKWTEGGETPIDHFLHPDLFFFRRNIGYEAGSGDQLEENLLNVMPSIVASKWPALTAAQANTQIEFDRAFRTIVQDPAYRDRNLLFISGLNVDISPKEGQLYPLTKFIPWAAYAQDEKGNQQTWEQSVLFEKLKEQSTDNPDQVDLEGAIEVMRGVEEIRLPF